MAHYYFFPAAVDVTADQVAQYADAYRRAHALPTQPAIGVATLTTLPPHLDHDAILAGLHSDQRDAVQRYLAQKAQEYAQAADDLVPTLATDSKNPVEFVALTEPWREYPVGTIGGMRNGGSVGVMALFSGWTIDRLGQLHFAAPPPPARVRPALNAPAADEAPAADDPYDDGGWTAIGMDGWGWTVPDPDPASQSHPVMQGIGDFVLELIQYVGNGIAFTNPLAGLTVAFVSTQSQKLVDSLGGASKLLGEVADMLASNNVTLESDFSRAAIRTYEGWAQTHFDATWINDIMTGDPKTPDVADKNKKLEEFVSTVTKDLDSRQAPVLTAVNLMAEDDPLPSKNLLKPSTAMLKAGGFFYGANYMLVRGRQAFNVQYTKEGAKASLDLAERLVAKSTEYLAYAQKLSAAVDQQVDARLTLIFPRRLTGGSEVWDLFRYYDGATPSDPNDLRGMVYESHPCCASGCDDTYNHMVALADRLKAIKKPIYRKKLCTWFWGDSTTATFDKALSDMKDNDDKLKALYDGCKKEAVQ